MFFVSRKISRILLAIVAVSLLIISTGCFKRDIIIASNNDPLILSESDGTYTLNGTLTLKGTSFLSPVVINGVTLIFSSGDGTKSFECHHDFTTQIAVGSNKTANVQLSDIKLLDANGNKMIREQAQAIEKVTLTFSFSGILPVERTYNIELGN